MYALHPSDRCFCENGDIGKLNKEANVNEKQRIFHIQDKDAILKSLNRIE